MTPKVPSSLRARRAALGAELKRVRSLAGISGRSLAGAIGASQAKVSRIESGQLAPSLPEVRAWGQAVNAASPGLADIRQLEWMAEQALTEAVPIAARDAEEGLAGIQDDIGGRLEATSRFIASFCPCYLTGLLQTAEYARRIYATFASPDEVEGAVGARLARQQKLWDASRRFEFILTEAALRWRSGPADFLLPQLDRVASLATLPNISVCVIPVDAGMHTASVCEFTLYDDRDGGDKPVAAVETLHQYIETEDVQAYRHELDLLRRSALDGGEAIAWIRDLAARLA